jgi:hypothetical protein
VLDDDQSVALELLKGSGAGSFTRAGVRRICNARAESRVLASTKWAPSANDAYDGPSREGLRPTCNAVLEKSSKDAGPELAREEADARAWLERLRASRGACFQNGAKRPQPEKRPNPDEKPTQAKKRTEHTHYGADWHDWNPKWGWWINQKNSASLAWPYARRVCE